MSEPVLDPSRVTQTAKIIHAAVFGGLVAAFLVFLFLQGTVTSSQPAETERIFRVIGYALVAAAIVVPLVIRGRIPLRGSDLDVNTWWSENLPTALVLWAVAEGCGLGALVLGWVVNNTTLMAVGAAAGLAVLFVNRPSRLASGL